VFDRQISLSKTSTGGFRLSLQPAPAWTAILGLFLFSALCIVAGAGKILNLIFPGAAFAVGAFLYFRYPILYIGFSWWILLLTPFLRRLADYRSSYTDPSPMLIAPYLVIGLTLVTVYKYLPKANRQGGLPFILCFIGAFYAFLIGLINKQPAVVFRDTLDWLPQVSFGFHLWINWRNYPSYCQNIQRTFIWSVLVMGAYGVIQFVIAPEWDLLWIKNSTIANSNGGIPGPLSLRVWSTLNSPEPFAAFMAAALLLLFTQKGTLSIAASVPGYLSLLLTMVRAAWLGWFAGLLTLTSSLKAKQQMRLIVIVLVMTVLVVPLATIEPFSQTITTRVTSLSEISDDGSANIRKETFNSRIGYALTNVVGDGIGGGFMDNAFLATLTYFGWIGTLPYLGGMLLLVFSLFTSSEGSFDPFIGVTRAIVMSALVRMPVNGSIGAVSGVVFWGFLGIGMAAQKYYQHQRTTQLSQPLQQNPP